MPKVKQLQKDLAQAMRELGEVRAEQNCLKYDAMRGVFHTVHTKMATHAKVGCKHGAPASV